MESEGLFFICCFFCQIHICKQACKDITYEGGGGQQCKRERPRTPRQRVRRNCARFTGRQLTHVAHGKNSSNCRRAPKIALQPDFINCVQKVVDTFAFYKSLITIQSITQMHTTLTTLLYAFPIKSIYLKLQNARNYLKRPNDSKTLNSTYHRKYDILQVVET